MQGWMARLYSPTGNAYLYIAAIARCRSGRVCTTTPVLGPGQPAVRMECIRRIATPLISRAVSSNPRDLSSHMFVICETLATRGPHSRARVFPRQDLSVDSARVHGCSLVVYLYLAVRVIGLRSVMRAHELQIRLIIPRLGGYLAMFVLVPCVAAYLSSS